MIQLKEGWYEAIKVRKSRRKYTGEPIKIETLREIERNIEEINQAIFGARGVLVTEEPDKVFKGIIGSYGKIKNCPAYIAFIGNMTDPQVQEKLGYLGEAIILECTAQGLATCWVGGFFDHKVVKEQINLTGDEKVLAVTPIGYSPEDYIPEERVMSLSVASHKRKPLKELVIGLNKDSCPSWIKEGLEAARLAPSAVNRQPWRFIIEENSVTVKVDHPFLALGISKRLDCGIAMLHFQLGAYHQGIAGSWSFQDSPKVAKFTKEGQWE